MLAKILEQVADETLFVARRLTLVTPTIPVINAPEGMGVLKDDFAATTAVNGEAYEGVFVVSPTFNACAYIEEYRARRNKDPFGTHEGPRLKVPKTQRSERSVFQRFYKPKVA